MKTKKFLSSITALAIAASTFAGFAITANADDTTYISPIATVIQGDGAAVTNADTVFYSAEADNWNISQSSISGAAFKNSQSNYDGSPVLIMKFDASNLTGSNIYSATLKFGAQCTVSGKNSNIYLASINTGWDETTATWNNTNTGDILNAVYLADLGNSGSTTVNSFTYDVTELLQSDDDKIIGLALYTHTGREQNISNVQLEVVTTEVAMYDVTINTTPYAAIKSGDDVVTYSDVNGKAVLTGSEGTTVNYTIEKNGYNSSTTGDIVFDSNKEISRILMPSEDDVLYFEDYSSTGIENRATGLMGDNRYMNNVLQIFANCSVALNNISGRDGYKIDIASLNVYIQNPGNRSRTKSIEFKNGNTSVFKIESVMTSGADPITTLYTATDSVALTNIGVVSLTILDGKLTGTVGTQVIDLTASSEVSAIDSVVYSGNNDTYLTVEVGSMKISGVDKEIGTAPTATYKFINEFKTETGDNAVDKGSAYNLFVTPGTDEITSVTVKVNGTSADQVATTQINSGSAVFAIAVNALKDEVTSITAVLNGVDYTATEKTE